MTDFVTDPNEFADVEGLFEDRKGSGGIYLSIFDFSICQRTPAKEKGAGPDDPFLPIPGEGWDGPHERNNPKTKKPVWTYVKRYDRMIARIADISKHTKEFGPESGGGKVTNWDIALLTGGQRMTLQLTYIDHVLKRFLKVAPNIDLRRPILISAFKATKNGESKQAVSFRQYRGDLGDKEAFRNVDKWDKVEEYWKAEQGPNGERIEGAKYTAPDGSVLPPPEHDEETDTWDYKGQNRFLSVYFKDNILPKIKELAAQYGIQSNDTDSSAPGDSITHTGPPQDDSPVTEKPLNPVASSIGDMISGKHTARIKDLTKALGMESDFATQRLVGAPLADLTDEAGRYCIGKLIERCNKTGTTIPPEPDYMASPAIPDKKPTPPEPDDDLWDDDDNAGSSAAPQQTGAQAFAEATGASVGNNDDVDW